MHLKVAAVQIESALGQVGHNLDKHAQWIERAAREDADLVFFPECSLTGYSTVQSREYAIGCDDEAVRAVEGYARERGVAVGFGFIEQARPEDDARDVNSDASDASASLERRGGLFITYEIAHGSERLIYRKTHLGSRERDVFAAGDVLPTAHVAGVCVGVQLCWEAHIPDIAATLRAKGAQLVICPHAGGLGGQRRVESWDRYLTARALDNGMYVAACNALRHDADGRPSGGGMVAYGPDGVCIASDASAEEGMLVVDASGVLPRDLPDDVMKHISYFDRRRPELYVNWPNRE